MGQRSPNKKPDTRPARARYWATRSLERKKVRALVKNTGMSEAEARKFWKEVRKGRLK